VTTFCSDHHLTVLLRYGTYVRGIHNVSMSFRLFFQISHSVAISSDTGSSQSTVSDTNLLNNNLPCKITGAKNPKELHVFSDASEKAIAPWFIYKPPTQAALSNLDSFLERQNLHLPGNIPTNLLHNNLPCKITGAKNPSGS
jgi:hypothetical protein